MKLSRTRIISILCLLIVAICAGATILPVIGPSDRLERTTPLHIVDYGHHLGLVLPRTYGLETGSRKLFDWASVLEVDTTYDWVEFGWGDDSYYPAHSDSVSVSLAIRALFASTGSVVKVLPLRSSPVWARTKRVVITTNQASTLTQFLLSELRTNRNGQPVFVCTGEEGPHARYYRSARRYSIINNCNVWSALALRMAGQTTPLHPLIPRLVDMWIDNDTLKVPDSLQARYGERSLQSKH